MASGKAGPWRIALVGQWGDRLRPPGGGSVAICTRYLARALVARGCAVRVYGVEWDRPADATFEEAGVGYHLLRPGRADRLLWHAFRKTRRWHPLLNRGRPIPDWSSRATGPGWHRRIAEDLRQNPVDIVLCQHSARPVPVLKRFLPDTPVIVQLHAISVPQAMSRSYRACLMQADAVSGVSPFVAQDAAHLLGRPVAVIRNGCDLSDADRWPARTEGVGRILYAGAVSPEKGVHVLAQAFALLCQEGRDVSLELVGGVGARGLGNVLPLSGDQGQRALESLFASDYGAHLRDLLGPAALARTVFAGQRSHAEVLAAMARADVFVFPSLCEEGFGLPPVEAMTMGAVAVVSDRGPLPWIVSQTAGLVVPPGDAPALAAAIARLLDDPGLRARLAQEGQQRAPAVFSWDAAAGDLLVLAAQLRSQAP